MVRRGSDRVRRGSVRARWGSVRVRWNERLFLSEYSVSGALIKKKIKFSSYIGKFRVEQLQSHIWLTATSYMGKYFSISSYIIGIGSPSSYMTLQLLHSEFPYTMRKIFVLFFISVWATETVYHWWLLIPLTPLPKTMVRNFSKQLWPKKLWSASMAGICSLHLFPALASLVRNWRIEITLH